MSKYSIKIVWSDEDEAFLATIPELPGLSAFGDTPGEAAQEASLLAQDMIEIKMEEGDPIPEPLKKKEYSGQFRLRLPKSLHESLSIQAEEEGVSLNTHLLHLIAKQFTLYSVKQLYLQESNRQLTRIKQIRDKADVVYWSKEIESENRYNTTHDDLDLLN